MKADGPRSSWLRPALYLILVVACFLTAYAPVLRAGFIWDDDDYVTKSEVLRSGAGLRRIWTELGAVHQYYPLVHTSFWLEYQLWGLSPVGFHVVNVLLHATSALLFWRLLLRLGVPGAWLAAVLLAVHPVEVESVAWITERKNVLSLTLALASLLCYLRCAPLGDTASPHRRRWYALALLCFVGAMLSKTVVATLPAVIVVLIWWRKGSVKRQDLLPLVPLFAIGIGLGLVTVWMEKHHVGASGDEWNLSALQRLLIAGRVLWFYAGKLLWPAQLAFFYPRWTIDQYAWWQYLFPLTALVTLIALWAARGRIGRGPLAAALIFAGVLTPALGFFDVFPFRYSFVADHFQYHASLALLALLAAAFTTAVGRWPLTSRNQIVSGAITAALLAAYTAQTHERAKVYENVELLYRDTIAKNPTGWVAYANLGVYLESTGRYAEALELTRHAVELAPREAPAHNNYGICLLRLTGQSMDAMHEDAEPVAQFLQAIELDPKYSDAYVNLATAHIAKQQFAEALTATQQALQANPRHADAHYTLGGLLARQGDLAGAQESYRRAVELRPGFARAWNNLGVVQMNQGVVDAALASFRRAAAEDPDYAEARENLRKAELVRQEQAAGHQP